MRRPLLIAVMAVGTVITTVGGTGLFAALSDSADTGTSSVRSRSLTSSAELKIASISQPNVITCGAFSDALTTPFITVTDAQPGTALGGTRVCIKNEGSRAVDLSATLIDLVDTDVACTGDEAVVDGTCGANQAGELSSQLFAGFVEWNCATGEPSETSYPADPSAVAIESTVGSPIAMSTLAPGATRCFDAGVGYASAEFSLASEQALQSDETTWRYRFTGQAI